MRRNVRFDTSSLLSPLKRSLGSDACCRHKACAAKGTCAPKPGALFSDFQAMMRCSLPLVGRRGGDRFGDENAVTGDETGAWYVSARLSYQLDRPSSRLIMQNSLHNGSHAVMQQHEQDEPRNQSKEVLQDQVVAKVSMAWSHGRLARSGKGGRAAVTVYGCGESARSPAGHTGVGGRHTSGSSREPVCVITADGLQGTDAAASSPKPGTFDSCRFGCAQGRLNHQKGAASKTCLSGVNATHNQRCAAAMRTHRQSSASSRSLGRVGTASSSFRMLLPWHGSP